MITEIWLEDVEMRMCGHVGNLRFENAIANRRREGTGPSLHERTPRLHVIGAQCEFACSIIVNRYWRPHIGKVGKDRQPDVGGCLEVRSTDLPYGRLIVKPDDPEWPTALIFHDDRDRRYCFLGWAMASRVKQEPLLHYPDNDPAHFLPQCELRDLTELKEYLRRYDEKSQSPE